MDPVAEEDHIRKFELLQALQYVQQVKYRFRHNTDVYNCFLHLMNEYKDMRLDTSIVLKIVSELLDTHPDMIKGFFNHLPYAVANELRNEQVEKPRPAKKAKMEDDSTRPLTEHGAVGTCSYNYSYRTHSSYAPGSSSHSCPQGVVVLYDAQEEEAAQLKKGTVYVTEMKQKLLDGPEVYRNFVQLVEEIKTNRVNIYSIMERASHLLQGYPELIEGFNRFLPDGYRIVVLPNDQERSTD